MGSAPSSTSGLSFAALVQAFFTQYLVEQRAMSPRTVATYRDAFVLFLAFAQKRLRKLPCWLSLRGYHAGVDSGLPGSSGTGAA